MGGIIQANGSTFVSLGNLNPANGNAYVLLALFGIILAFALMVVKNKYINTFAILISMFVVAAIGLILGAFNVPNMPSFSGDTGSIGDIKDVFGKSILAIPTILTKPQTYGVVFSFVMVHLFDTSATLIAISEPIGAIDKETGKVKVGTRVMMADATGGIISGIFGTSPVTSFAESTVGVESGARTGIAAITTGLLFFLSLAIFPVFNVFAGINVNGTVYTPCTSMALVSVGALMFSNLRKINWNEKIDVMACFITFIMILLTYSITNGIALGLIFYAVMRLVSGKGKETSPVIWILAVLFTAMFVVDIFVTSSSSLSVLNCFLNLQRN